MLPSRLLGAAAAVALFPATASAAYAPKLSVSIDPATPSARARIASTITQGASETASKTVVVSIPSGFSAPVDSLQSLPACTTQQVNARACPDSTRIGSAEATASVLGLPQKLGGSVNWGGPTGDGRFVIIVFLDNEALNQHLTLKGFIGVRPDGGFDTTFDGLPNTTTTKFTLIFDGGTKAVLVTPNHCGDFPFQAAFTSQQGERAQSTAPTTISGCKPPPLTLSRVSATRTSFTFRVNQPAIVRILVKGPGSKVRVDRKVDAAAGTTTTKWRKPLRYGVRYRMAFTATGDGGAATKKLRRTFTRRR